MSNLSNTAKSYAIVGFGNFGQALAGAFARKGIEVAVATTHTPESFAATAAKIGPTIKAEKMAEALKADVIFLAARFEAYPQIAQQLPSWEGKTIVDVTNAYGFPPEKLGGQPSSSLVAQAFTGSRLVKGFNHLAAAVFNQDPAVNVGKRAVFLASDDAVAAAEIAELAKDLGFAPIQLGGLAEGGQLVQARGTTWGPLIFQDLIKFS